MSDQSVIERLFSAHLIEDAMLAQLRERLPAYVLEIFKQYGFKLPMIKSWGVVTDYERWPSTNLPALLVAAEGINGNPVRTSDGWHTASWAVEVSVTLSGPTGPDTRKAAQLYAAAVRGAVMQRRSLGINASVEWADEDYGGAPSDDRLSIFTATNAFAIEVKNVVSDRKGPKTDEFPDEVPDEWPEVIETQIETEIT